MMDWTNQDEVLRRRQQAIDLGYKPTDVDKFIAGQRELQTKAGAFSEGVYGQAGITPSEDVVLEAHKRGLEFPEPEMTAQEIKADQAKTGIVGLTDELKRLYNLPTPGGASPREGGDLATGVAGFPAFLSRAMQNAKIGMNLAPNAKTYKRMKEGFAASLKELTGDTGVLTDQDYARLVSSLPDFGDSDKTARQAWESFDRIINAKLGTTGQFSYLPEQDVGGFEQRPEPTLMAPEEEEAKKKDIDVGGVARRAGEVVSGAAPAVGGMLGGIGGGILGAGAASVPLSAGGTYLGWMAGETLSNALDSLMGEGSMVDPQAAEEAITDAGTAAALDLVTGAVFSGVGAAVKGLGRATAGFGDNLALRAIRPTKSQQMKFAQKTGQELQDFVIDKGLFKKGVEQADELIVPLQKSFDDIAVNSGRTIDPGMVKQGYDDILNQYKHIPNRKVQQFVKKLAQERDLFMDMYGQSGPIKIDKLTQMRRAIDDVLPANAFLKEEVDSAVDTISRRVYQKAIRDVTADMTDDAGRSLAQIGKELQKLYEFKNIAAMQQYLGTSTLPVGLLRQIGIGAVGGGAVGGFQSRDLNGVATGAAIGLGIPAIMNNPKVIAALARSLPKLGGALEAVPDNQKVKFVTEAFRRILTNFGAAQMNLFGEDDEDVDINNESIFR